MKEVKDNSNISSEEKSRKKYTISVIIICTLIISFCCFSVYYFNDKLISNQKNATNNTCMMPYSTKNCKYARNETVKQIQKMLNNQGYYNKSYGYDGNFGPKTVVAVKAFQRSKGLGADGYVGPGTLEELAKATNTAYFKIKYDKAGGTGSLNSQYNNTQVILNGVATKISTTKLTKNNSTHVGYIATTTLGSMKIRYGCFGKNCSSNYRIYTEAQIKATSKPFNDYVYSIGEEFSNNVWMTGQQITFTAKYCNKNETYDKTTNQCKENASTSTPSQPTPPSSGNYDHSITLSAYVPYCRGCSGYVYCPLPNNEKFTQNNYKYTDSQYGEVRVVAGRNMRNNSTTPCGTIIEIQEYKVGTKKYSNVKAIVIDQVNVNGRLDFMVPTVSETQTMGIQTINYKILRKGW